MDVKHRKAYAKISILGVKEDIFVNQGMSLAQLLIQEIPRILYQAPNRYEGFTIEFGFKEIEKHETTQEKFTREIYEGLDMSLVEQATEEEELLYAQGNPSDPRSSIYDPLYFEYMKCLSSNHRETKTPEDLVTLRKHMETHYTGTKWWNGVHKW